MLGNLGITEILIVVGVVVLLFGARRIPEVGRSLGQGINNFYRSLTGRADVESPPLPRSSDRE
jgi:sec-independent protein translocase protein TatA